VHFIGRQSALLATQLCERARCGQIGRPLFPNSEDAVLVYGRSITEALLLRPPTRPF
jgi:hypothetical protein